MANLNGRVTKMENATDQGTLAPGYIQAKTPDELERKLAEMPPGWRGKAYVGSWGPDDWDAEVIDGSEQTS